jgi:arginyl-tRNA--protein-N-Asp/Glu arginylyltransferase
VVAKEFKRQRSLSRTWKANSDLLAVKVPARATSEQFDLFQR